MRARPEYSRIATRDRSLPNHPGAILRSHGGRRPSAECIGTSPLPLPRLAGGERYGSYARTVISPVEPSTSGGPISTTIFGRVAVAKNCGWTRCLRVVGCHCWLAQQCGFLLSPCGLNQKLGWQLSSLGRWSSVIRLNPVAGHAARVTQQNTALEELTLSMGEFLAVVRSSPS